MTLQNLPCLTTETRGRRDQKLFTIRLMPCDQYRNVEVQQQSQTLVHKLQIRQQLRLMDRQQLFNCLYFNDYRIIHEQIEPVAVIELEFVVERSAPFARSTTIARLCATRESGTCDTRFQATRPKF